MLIRDVLEMSHYYAQKMSNTIMHQYVHIIAKIAQGLLYIDNYELSFPVE